MNPQDSTIADRFADRAALLAAMQRAIDVVRWKHAIAGRRVCVWKDGRVEWVEAEAGEPPAGIIWYDA
ncbi:MAG: hypothetical protein K2X38_14025 [Gemmataceae bacterium]|nr:hypothetical protein [Gemmataceae bacterium]